MPFAPMNLKRAMMGIDIGRQVDMDHGNTLCDFLQRSDELRRLSKLKEGDEATPKNYDSKEYTGQKRHISRSWQLHVWHYMQANLSFRNATSGNSQGGPCIPIDPSKSIYGQVVEYALGSAHDE